MNVQDIVTKLDLKPHPKGGFYSEPYRSNEVLPKSSLPSRFGGDRNISTLAYLLLSKGNVSHFGRIKSDEILHFYSGGPLTIVEIEKNGNIQKTVLGSDLLRGNSFSHTIPAGNWFGLYLNEKTDYSLIGATVAPGFDFADMEIGNRADLLKQFPHAKAEIERLTDE